MHTPCRLQRKDGEYIWVYETVRVLRDASGRVCNYVGYLHDISAQVNKETELQAEKKYLDYIAHHDPLTGLPSRTLFIDQSFVRDVELDDDDKAIVLAIVAMAKSLGLKTVAEGVETQKQSDYLAFNGCGSVQGYFYSRPLPVGEAVEFMWSNAYR